MRALIAVFSVCFIFCAHLSMAQNGQVPKLDKKEAKEWKRAAKDYKKNPEQLKALVEERNTLRDQALVMQRQVDKQGDEIGKLREEIHVLRAQLTAAEQAAAQPVAAQECPTEIREGTYFRVQIGAYQKGAISEDMDTAVDFGVERLNDMNLYVLGQFRDYQQADKFKKGLRAMGVKDAFIVPYTDGQRVQLKDVMDQIPK